MGSSDFLQALLSTEDESYSQNFSLQSKLLLKFSQIFFPNYIKRAAKTRLKLKKDIINATRKYNPNILIEIGSGHSKDYLPLLQNNLSQLIQIDRELIIDSSEKGYKFLEGDITKKEIWSKISNLGTKKGVIVAEGVFSYLNDKEFDFVISEIKSLLKKGFTLITHEPIGKISNSRKIISFFIGKTYRRFSSIKQLKEYYSSFGLKARIFRANKWQIIYEVRV